MNLLSDFYSPAEIAQFYRQSYVPLIKYMTPLAVIICIIESIVFYSFSDEKWDWRASLANFACNIGQVIIYLFPFSFVLPIYHLAWKYRIFHFKIVTEDLLISTLLVLAVFLGVEFLYYWMHRVSHNLRWLWINHSAHHSSIQFNMTASFRNGWFTKYIGAYLFFTPLIFLGFSGEAVFTAFAANVYYQFWIHNAWMPKFGWLEYVFNTPSAHRVHHARNDHYVNANYGGILIVFDRLFGTYKEERENLPVEYGLIEQNYSYNPFVIVLKEWWLLIKDVRDSKSLTEALACFVRYPPDPTRPAKNFETDSVSQSSLAKRPVA